MKEIIDKINFIYLNNFLKELQIYDIGLKLIKRMNPEMPFNDFVSIINGFGLKLKLIPKDETIEEPKTNDDLIGVVRRFDELKKVARKQPKKAWAKKVIKGK